MAERLNTLDVDVLNASGILAYIHGSRHLRLLALSKDYKINREKNVESSLNVDTGVRIAYQNVDRAASSLKAPRAISGKKSGSADVIKQAQGSMFPANELPEAINSNSIQELNSSFWYLCASFDDENVRGELSLPASIENGNFHGFLERIFITQGSGWIGIPAQTTDEDMVEFEPKIARK